MLAFVIPYYKIKFFETTLQTLSNQTDKRFKVYIGNDASPEDPVALLDKYKSHFDFVYYKFEENLGGISLVKQWERCITMVEDEEWLMVLGDDDYLSDNVVEEFHKQYEKFQSTCNVVRYSTVVLNEQNDSKSKIFEHPTLEYGLEYFIRKIKGGTRNSMSEFFFKKEAYLKLKFVNYPSAFYSDDRAMFDFSIDKPIYTINNAIVFVRISDYSISGGQNREDLIKAEFYFLKYFYDYKLQYFKKTEKLLILNRLENSLSKNNVKYNNLWIRLYLSYLLCFNRIQFIKFNKRLLRKILLK